MANQFSPYYDPSLVASQVAQGRHRELIGGLWDEIGRFQFELLLRYGLAPDEFLLDIGCGSLRGGVHFVSYLQPARYFGVDLNPPLLEAGYAEIVNAGLKERLPRSHLVASGEFEFDLFAPTFDRALALSLFTHLPFNAVRICLERLAPKMKAGGILHATYFETSDAQPSYANVSHHPGGVVTHGASDPYHYRVADFFHAAAGLPWSVEPVGDVGHPRGQKLINFRRLPADAGPTGPQEATRRLPVAEADLLHAGADHYRAYVGPPDRFDFMSASQFALLFQLGLRDHHRVLDFGCGSLRLGRLLIPFLRRGKYFGIDPNRWLIEDGIDRELGRSAVALKQPRFDHGADFDCCVFGERFDAIIAQSIVTHTGPDLAVRLFTSAAQALAPKGLLLFSYTSAQHGAAAASPGWHYPGCVAYKPDDVAAMLSRGGLVGTALPWHHPGACWYAAACDKSALPSPQQASQLTGATLNGFG
ncbi:MAG: methyltransferase domain-containing protein [Hyphomicrobiales bacterium]|nr:methyltransferase domain-containing protein [Hyphomicrobiales bacterium]